MSIERKKEKDLVVRQKLIRELDKAREYIKIILDEPKIGNNDEISDIGKSLMDDLDIFSNEIELSEVGHKYPLFSPQKSASGRTVKKLIKYDSSIIEMMEDVKEACKRLYDAIINNEDIDIEKELLEIRHYITNVKNNYLSRIDKLKGVK